MGFLDRLLGRAEEPARANNPAPPAAKSADEIAVERYRYLLRTAPPETIEQVHAEAFSKLTPAQRDIIFTELTTAAQAGDAPASAAPEALARSATRSEIRQPGVLERTLSGPQSGLGGGMGFGGMFASSLLGSVAGFVIGSAIAQAFIPDSIGTDQSTDAGQASDSASDQQSGASDPPADSPAQADTVSADGGSAGFGGDFGGGFSDSGFGDFGDFGL